MPNIETRQAIDSRHARTLDTEGLRAEFLIEHLFESGETNLVYSHLDCFICRPTKCLSTRTLGNRRIGSGERSLAVTLKQVCDTRMTSRFSSHLRYRVQVPEDSKVNEEREETSARPGCPGLYSGSAALVSALVSGRQGLPRRGASHATAAELATQRLEAIVRSESRQRVEYRPSGL